MTICFRAGTTAEHRRRQHTPKKWADSFFFFFSFLTEEKTAQRTVSTSQGRD